MIKKRIVASILTAVLLIGSLGVSVQAEEDNAQTENIAADVEVTAEDSFGAMTANLLDGEIDKQEENDGCNIFSIEMDGAEASVELETNQYASLIVAVYDESGVEMLASGNVDVVPGDEEAVVEVETDQMPEYFYLKGFLVDYETFEPYCTAYESPMYTCEMQEFLSKTTSDFAGQEILNFDGDTKNNFAVYNDKTIVVDQKSGENEVVKSDEENQIYVIENADETVTSLTSGDIFSYEYVDGTVLIIKVASVEVDGTTVRITGEETSLEEVFDYVKIDTEQFADDAEIDSSTCDEGVTYEGIERSRTARAVDIDVERSSSVSLKLEKELGETSKLTGSLKLKMGASLKLYVSWSYQYVELKMDYSAEVSTLFSGQCDLASMKLINFNFMPIPGVIINITPSFIAEASGEIDLTGTLKGCVGFAVSSDNGMKNITRNPTFDAELQSEVVVYIGLSLKPNVKIISDTIAKAEVGAEAGVEIKAEQSTEKEESGPTIHECDICFDGDVTAKCNLSFNVNLLQIFKYNLSKNLSAKVADFYWSVDYGEFAFTTCPHILYRVTVIVKDSEGNAVNEAQINDEYVTNENGKVSFYLPEGKYTLTVQKQDFEKRKKIYVKNKAKEVSVRFDEKVEEDSGEEEDTRAKVVAVDMEQYYGAAILDDGSLWTWGLNNYGQLGDGTKESRSIPKKILNNVKSVDLGYNTGAAIKTDGTLWVWGNNMYGFFGNGTTESSMVPIQVMDNVDSIAFGEGAAVAVKKDGSLWSWGLNGFGQLGNGVTITPSTIPVKIMEDVRQADIVCYHGAAVKKDGSLWIWGRNNSYQLGDGTNENRSTPFKLMDDVKSVSLGMNESSVIKEDGSLWAWGSNAYGQIGASQDNYQTNVVTTPIKVMDNVSKAAIFGRAGAAVTTDGNLWMWGDDLSKRGQSGENPTIKKMTSSNVLDVSFIAGQAALMTGTVAMIKSDNSLWTWGYNGHNQTGTGLDGLYIEEPVNITGLFTETEQTDLNLARTALVANQHEAGLPDTAIPVTSIEDSGEGLVSVVVEGLEAGETYNLYAVKNYNEENVFSGGNLLYISQAATDENGELRRTYKPLEMYENAHVFVARLAEESNLSGDDTDSDYLPGDVNGDGEVKIDDLRIVLRIVCRKTTLTNQQKMAADVETDGKVDIQDLRKILRFVCGKIESL